MMKHGDFSTGTEFMKNAGRWLRLSSVKMIAKVTTGAILILWGVGFLAVLGIPFLIVSTGFQVVFDFLYDAPDRFLFHPKGIGVLSGIVYGFLLLVLVMYFFAWKNWHKGPATVPKKRKILWIMTLFVTLPLLLASVGILTARTYIDLNTNQLNRRTFWGRHEVISLSDITMVDFRHNYNHGKRGGAFEAIRFHIKDGNSFEVTLDDLNLVQTVFMIPADATCRANGDFLYQKSGILRGHTKRQEIGASIANYMKRLNLGIPDECRWLIDETIPAPRSDE